MSDAREMVGHSSTVRFVPDEWRGEGVNLGVVLLCPEAHYLGWKLTTNHQRARRFFGQDQTVDLARIKILEAELCEHLEGRRGALQSVADLDRLAKRFRNQLQLSPPRPCVVTQPGEDLARLFARLVEPPGQPAPHDQPGVPSADQMRRELADRLRERQIYDRLAHDVEIPATYRVTPYTFAHAYQNGRFNIVHEVSFGLQDPDHNCERALVLAGEVEDVRHHADDRYRQAGFRLIASFVPDQRDAEGVIRRLLADKAIEIWTPDELTQLVGIIAGDLQAH